VPSRSCSVDPGDSQFPDDRARDVNVDVDVDDDGVTEAVAAAVSAAASASTSASAGLAILPVYSRCLEPSACSSLLHY